MLTGAALMTALAVAAVPAGGATRPRHLDAEAAASARAPSGLAFGGITTQSWPVVVALNKARNRVDQLVVGLDMTCTSGDDRDRHARVRPGALERRPVGAVRAFT